jgi:hypothetical protein
MIANVLRRLISFSITAFKAKLPAISYLPSATAGAARCGRPAHFGFFADSGQLKVFVAEIR